MDPNEDPELALALRVSMEENRARQAREEAAAGSATMDTSTVEPGSGSAGNYRYFVKVNICGTTVLKVRAKIDM